jgi:hypothetical protein
VGRIRVCGTAVIKFVWRAHYSLCLARIKSHVCVFETHGDPYSSLYTALQSRHVLYPSVASSWWSLVSSQINLGASLIKYRISLTVQLCHQASLVICEAKTPLRRISTGYDATSYRCDVCEFIAYAFMKCVCESIMIRSTISIRGLIIPEHIVQIVCDDWRNRIRFS